MRKCGDGRQYVPVDVHTTICTLWPHWNGGGNWSFDVLRYARVSALTACKCKWLMIYLTQELLYEHYSKVYVEERVEEDMLNVRICSFM